MQNKPYKCQRFTLKELLPPDFYEANKHLGDLLWMIFDDRLLRTLDRLAFKYGRIVVNNYGAKGGYKESGYRLMDSGVGANLSAHKFGRGADAKFLDTPLEEVWKDMEEVYGCFEEGYKDKYDPEDPFRDISRVEETKDGERIDWFHLDTSNCDLSYILRLQC